MEELRNKLFDLNKAGIFTNKARIRQDIESLASNIEGAIDRLAQYFYDVPRKWKMTETGARQSKYDVISKRLKSVMDEIEGARKLIQKQEVLDLEREIFSKWQKKQSKAADQYSEESNQLGNNRRAMEKLLTSAGLALERLFEGVNYNAKKYQQFASILEGKSGDLLKVVRDNDPELDELLKKVPKLEEYMREKVFHTTQQRGFRQGYLDNMEGRRREVEAAMLKIIIDQINAEGKKQNTHYEIKG